MGIEAERAKDVLLPDFRGRDGQLLEQHFVVSLPAAIVSQEQTYGERMTAPFVVVRSQLQVLFEIAQRLAPLLPGSVPEGAVVVGAGCLGGFAAMASFSAASGRATLS